MWPWALDLAVGVSDARACRAVLVRFLKFTDLLIADGQLLALAVRVNLGMNGFEIHPIGQQLSVRFGQTLAVQALQHDL